MLIFTLVPSWKGALKRILSLFETNVERLSEPFIKNSAVRYFNWVSGKKSCRYFTSVLSEVGGLFSAQLFTADFDFDDLWFRLVDLSLEKSFQRRGCRAASVMTNPCMQISRLFGCLCLSIRKLLEAFFKRQWSKPLPNVWRHQRSSEIIWLWRCGTPLNCWETDYKVFLCVFMSVGCDSDAEVQVCLPWCLKLDENVKPVQTTGDFKRSRLGFVDVEWLSHRWIQIEIFNLRQHGVSESEPSRCVWWRPVTKLSLQDLQTSFISQIPALVARSMAVSAKFYF